MEYYFPFGARPDNFSLEVEPPGTRVHLGLPPDDVELYDSARTFAFRDGTYYAIPNDPQLDISIQVWRPFVVWIPAYHEITYLRDKVARLQERARTAEATTIELKQRVIDDLKTQNGVLKDELTEYMAVQWRRDIEGFKALPIDHAHVSIWNTQFHETMKELTTNSLREPYGSKRHAIVSQILMDLNDFVAARMRGEDGVGGVVDTSTPPLSRVQSPGHERESVDSMVRDILGPPWYEYDIRGWQD
ncbi:hypothetical protein E2P81_ATG06375 [Venturia nashicola]|uniref:Uncharacterized protein n=1 Tax=Venturia nashicola TaxID=86259 RepID=A0A4Z1NY35_9PEZI|nr:hypothetical protein E6O75_ATG06529 [Venturia nashicola]TLD28029.1 hypothetical protein E2P81_ATG06375 [Venturia nashicola]